jgi:acyl-coenzyme A thioesterase PaaI-like protein
MSPDSVSGLSSYPPERHLLRDLRLAFDHSEPGRPRAWLPVVPEICGDDGAVRAGALAILVDVIGGGLAAETAQPNWIATADLTLHLTAAATTGAVEARARVLRAGRTTVVLEVVLSCDTSTVGLATMSFSVLPRRDINPDIAETRPSASSTMALEDSQLTAPLDELVGIRTVDAGAGAVELPVRDWAKNSMGALQGGVVGVAVEASAEAALRHACGRPLIVTDLQLSYLSFGKVGPLRASADVLEASDDRGVARVVLVDEGAEARQMTAARVVATRSLA